MLVAVGVLLMCAGFWLGLMRPPGRSGPALLCCLLAAMLFIGCFPGHGGHGGRPA